ncbi:hypothetical protein QWY86_03270 [Pedobacter aquatilis]|uniref:hypothetical protein n=1 Tax=Pedobacter aquatilis TaxID=351343 RepID=UPI0025B60D07|nr:hypothetical protein [Pedobacter aquatilis]MDN3585672.1 hypothetical protein [Pedobacter aquatilis]
MIAIDKGASPMQLAAVSLAKQQEFALLYDASKLGYDDGSLKFDIGNQYASAEVRAALKVRQYNKCCFSEAKFCGDYPNVEHFRPKKRVDSEGKTSVFPGYYWLAYQWDNLFYCKVLINCSYKRNFFPLMEGSDRKLNHHGQEIEHPVLIDPSIENPRDHIHFHLDEPIGITQRGKENIKLLGLRDSSFEESRRSLLIVLKTYKELVEGFLANGYSADHNMVKPLMDRLIDSMKPSAEFSSMAIDFLTGWHPLELIQAQGENP